MKDGKAIIYVGSDGERHEATCAAIVGEGASNAKILNVAVPSVGKEPIEGVPYVADRTDGAAYWQLVTDPDIRE